MLTKEKIIDSINLLPDEFSLEDVIERVVLIEKIERGIQESENGKLIPDDELNKHLPSWLL